MHRIGHPGYDDDSQYPEDDDLDYCATCDGVGGYHDCGEDTCCCADPEDADDAWVTCPDCGGASVL